MKPLNSLFRKTLYLILGFFLATASVTLAQAEHGYVLLPPGQVPQQPFQPGGQAGGYSGEVNHLMDKWQGKILNQSEQLQMRTFTDPGFMDTNGTGLSPDVSGWYVPSSHGSQGFPNGPSYPYPPDNRFQAPDSFFPRTR